MTAKDLRPNSRKDSDAKVNDRKATDLQGNDRKANDPKANDRQDGDAKANAPTVNAPQALQAVDAKVKDKVCGKGEPKARLDEVLAALPAWDFSSDAAIEAAIKALAEGKGLGFGDYQAVTRLALTGTNAGPSITAIFRVLGRERSRARLAKLRASLG